MSFGSTELIPHADRTSVGPRYAHSRPYQHGSEPDSYHRQQPSHVSRPLPTAALRLQDPQFRCERDLGWNIDWAVAFIVDRLEQKSSPAAADILKAIRARAANLDRDGHSSEIPYRMFNKLDETIFAGHLKNAVYLDIRRLGSDVSGATHSQGWGLDPKVKRISIILNGELLQRARSWDIIATLLHHMIHAYFLVACGPQHEKEVDYGRLGHGLHFGKIMKTIRKLSATHRRPLTALDFGHTLGQSRCFYDEYQHQRRMPYHRRRGKEKWYCSHCHSDIYGIPEGEINEWYNGVCKPLFDLPESLRSASVQIYNDRRHFLEEISRAETTPSTASSEFIFRDKPVLVPESHIANFFSIRRAFEKGASRYLEIHKDVGKDTFERFLELLHTGTYGPDPKHIQAMGRKGPPVIKSPTSSEPYILTDIRIFKMGCLMGFEELKGIALDRMYRHSITHEDPVALLKAIYDGPEPDSDLKVWVRKFLARMPSSGDNEWSSAPRPMVEPPNLAKLESDLLGYKPAFCDLLQQSSALKYEVSQARRELLGNGMYAVPGIFGGLGMAGQRSMTPPMGVTWGSPIPALSGRLGMMGLPWMPGTEDAMRAAEPYAGRGLGLGYEDFEDRSWPYE